MRVLLCRRGGAGGELKFGILGNWLKSGSEWLVEVKIYVSFRYGKVVHLANNMNVKEYCCSRFQHIYAIMEFVRISNHIAY